MDTVDEVVRFENVACPLIERGLEDESELRQRVADALGMVDMAGTEEVMPSNLSGGMRKRVGLARAVVQAGKLGLTSVVVTHDIATAYMLSDRLAMLAERRIVEVSEVAQFRASKNPHVRAFLDATALPKRAPRAARDAMSGNHQRPDAE
jgi:phospholipid/cholesterol/gamma-HCH transport system ATP-binding protein